MFWSTRRNRRRNAEGVNGCLAWLYAGLLSVAVIGLIMFVLDIPLKPLLEVIRKALNDLVSLCVRLMNNEL